MKRTLATNPSTLRIRRYVLATVTVAGLLAGATGCGGDDGSASNDAEVQALIEQLLAAAQEGATPDELADLLAEADPDLITQVVPEIENRLDIDVPETTVAPTTLPGGDDQTSPQGDGSGAGPSGGSVPTITAPGGIPTVPGLATPSLPSTTKAPAITPPGGTPSIPGPGTPSLPSTTKAPAITLPGGTPSIPGPGTPSLPPTSAPANTTITFDLVQLTDRGSSKFLQVILSVDSIGKPAFVDLNYDSTSGVVTRRLSLDFVEQMDPNTSLWTLSMRSDTDPCSLRFTIIPDLLVNTKGITQYKNFMGC